MKRALNIALRTAHIGSMGTLLGGLVFGVAFEKLVPGLWLTAGTGLALAVVEAGGRLGWLHEGRGLMTLLKLGLLSFAPLAGGQRLPVLFAVVVVASVGSHMPRQYRHYSVLYRKVMLDGRDMRGAARGQTGDRYP